MMNVRIMTKTSQSIGGIDVTKRQKKKLLRRMGFRHYRDAKAVEHMADILVKTSYVLDESTWPTRSDIAKLQEDYINNMTKVYQHILRTGQVPQNDKELKRIIQGYKHDEMMIQFVDGISTSPSINVTKPTSIIVKHDWEVN